MYNILIVDKTMSPGMRFLDALRVSDAHVRFVHQNTQAIKLVKKDDYDLIILGDRTDDGTVYDVAMEIKDSRKNRHTAVVCVGANAGKVARIRKLLKPYALFGDKNHTDATVARVRAHFKAKLEQSTSTGE
jgi:DNA-binding response OmpR family regulator